MAKDGHYNHIHPESEESYGSMHKKGGDHHLTANHKRGEAPGRHGHDGGDKGQDNLGA